MEGVRPWEETRRRAQNADRSVRRRSGNKIPESLPVYKKSEPSEPRENISAQHVRLLKVEKAKENSPVEEKPPVTRRKKKEFIPEKNLEASENVLENGAGDVPENLPVVEERDVVFPHGEELPLQKDLPEIEKEGVKNIGGRKAARAEFGYASRLERPRGRREGVRPPKQMQEIRRKVNKENKERGKEWHEYKVKEKQTIEERLDAVRQRVEDDLALDKRRRSVLSHVLDGTFSDISVRDFFYDLDDKDFSKQVEENNSLFQKNKQYIENLKNIFTLNEENSNILLKLKNFFQEHYNFVRGWGNNETGISPQVVVVERFFSFCEKMHGVSLREDAKYAMGLFLSEEKRNFENKKRSLEMGRRTVSRYDQKKLPLKEKYIQAYQDYLSSLENIIASL